jgi:ABC-type multidrug transport system fused ATPase/permease subunit
LLGLATLAPLVVVPIPLVERQVIDGVLLPQRLDLLPPIVGLYAGLHILSVAVHIGAIAGRTYLGERFSADLRQRLFAHTEALSVAFAHREHSGRTLALFTNDVPGLAGFFTTTVLNGVSSFLLLALGAVAMFSLSWQLAVVAAIVPPLVAGLATVVTRPLRPASRRAQEKAAELTERLQENLSGLREVVADAREQAQALRFAATLGELLRLRMRVTLIDTAIGSGQSLLSLAISLVILGYGGYLVVRGETTIGTLVAMRALFAYAFQPAGQVFSLVGAAQKALASADRVYAFLDERPRVAARPGARPPGAVRGAVAFEGVTFAYTPGRPVVADVTFAARPGEVVALVGPSGAGKSTLAALVARFYDPDAGRVTLDGVDLRDLTLPGLRREVGIVFQDSFLFAASVRDNIAFGREGADEAAIVAAARAAQAWEFIERLPEGLDTAVGERGVRLSEGQRQRLAIARALLRDSRVLILDEPTSALDARSEYLLQAALEALMAGRTTFVIAHRLATVRRADRILVLDGGRIIEEGTHDTLLAAGGLYRHLHDLQTGDDARSAGDGRAEALVAGRLGATYAR